MRNDLVTDQSAASAACRAIADPTRRRLLDVLLAGPASAGALAKRFSTSRPAIARHLGVLRRARLVSAQPRGRQRIYALRPKGLAPVSQWLAKHERFWAESLDALSRYLESEGRESERRRR